MLNFRQQTYKTHHCRLSSAPSVSVMGRGQAPKVKKYEPSNFQIMKIEASLGQLCNELSLDESIRSSYREKLQF